MNDCRGELLERVRRGLAAERDRLALDAHLRCCEVCRLTSEIAGDFDAEGEAAPNDAELVTRLAARARAAYAVQAAPPRRFTRLRRAAPLAIAAMVLSGLAAGAFALQQRAAEIVPPPDAPSEAAEARSVAQERATGTSGRGDAPAVENTEPLPQDVPASPPQPAAGPPEAPLPSASALYKLANEARRQGNRKTAMARYRTLQRRFPGSPEATLSRVSLGGLLLDSGATADALAQFDGYLAGGDRRLVPEALFGRGRALERLGRRAEEAHNWQRLVSTYPRSAYATHAKRRLQELQ